MPQSKQLEERVAAGILDLVKNVFYMDAVDLTELRVLKRDDGWLVILKGKREGQKLVAFFNADRFVDALAFAATSTDHGKSRWHLDRPYNGSSGK